MQNMPHHNILLYFVLIRVILYVRYLFVSVERDDAMGNTIGTGRLDRSGGDGDAGFFRRRRVELGLSRKEIARAAGVGVAAVGSWERIAAYPCLGRIDTLAGIYRVDVHRMLFNAKALADAVRTRQRARTADTHDVGHPPMSL